MPTLPPSAAWICLSVLFVFNAWVLIVMLAFFAGRRVPIGHTATRTIVLKRSRTDVWAVLSDFERHPTWCRRMKGIARLPDRDGRPVWAEKTKFGVIPYVVSESRVPDRLVTTIEGERRPFTGSWTYELADVGGGTRLTITEVGRIENPIMRGFAHYAFGYTRTMDALLKDLARHFGENAKPS